MDSPSSVRDAPTTFFGRMKHLGPSLILTATLVGSGELIVTTGFGAEAGFVALWIILGTCVLKVAIQEALGRYAIASGKTALQMLDILPGPRLGGGWGVWFWLFIVTATSIQLGGVAEGVGQALVLVFEDTGTFLRSWSSYVWATVVCALSLVMLLSGRYSVVERFSTIVVCLFSISIILCGLLLQGTEYAVSWSQIVEGLKFELPSGGSGKALAIVGAVGLSATELVYYPYWCLEKGYAKWTGPADDSQAWVDRAKGWIRVMQLDCYIALAIYTTTTIAFYFLGAAILHSKGLVPKGMDLVRTLSTVYTETVGPWAYFIFIGSSLLVLFSTLFVTIASYSRLVPDCLNILGWIRIPDEVSKKRWIRRFLFGIAIWFAIASRIEMDPVTKIVLGLSGLAFLLPVMAFAAIYLRYAKLDKRVQPSKLLDVWLWASGLLTVALMVFILVNEIRKLVGG